MCFHVGILYSTQELLGLVRSASIDRDAFSRAFPRFVATTGAAALETAQMGGWLCVTSEGTLTLTQSGKSLLELGGEESRLRRQLGDLVSRLSPKWSLLLANGRRESLPLLPSHVHQCFREAGLADGDDPDVSDWWFVVAGAMWGERMRARRETGYEGEKLSIRHEKARTGKSPLWQALESASAGYDVLSVEHTDDETYLMIEVKASERPMESACLYLTRNEWSTAESSAHYVFHLWLLNPDPRLCVIRPDELSIHLPEDCGKGVWQDARVPFGAFAHKQWPLEAR